MQMTPEALLKKQVIEGVIPESTDHQVTTAQIEAVLKRELPKLQELTPEELLSQRHQRYRKF